MSAVLIPAASPLTGDHLRQFEEQGFFVLERVIPAEHLEMLRGVCARLIGQIDEKADREGCPRTTKYFFSVWDEKQGENPVKDQARTEISQFVFSDLMAEITRALLGDTVYFSFEQFVVKAAEKGGTFAWHQDSAYVSTPHSPYLTCWCTLDDVTEENGTVYMMPYDRAGTRGLLPHTKLEDDFDLVGYRGDDPGVPVIIPAGSIAFFSSHVLHRSGPNTTPRQRRIYLPQYSSHPILREDGTPYYIAEPFLKDGQRVR
ncbi:MAG: phytanoyl-CoA dioxygenase family protein [Armatimonadota bacterium]|nr:phytanoyl-CoA dioxygenase family protein [Armatimonadota bacterium]